MLHLHIISNLRMSNNWTPSDIASAAYIVITQLLAQIKVFMIDWNVTENASNSTAIAGNLAGPISLT